jgi:hypothetical protein
MDHPQLRNSPEGRRIHLGEAHDVRYWCAAFNVSPEALEKAVRAAGTRPEAVRDYLQRRK